MTMLIHDDDDVPQPLDAHKRGHICSTLLRTIACVLRHSLLQKRIAGPAACGMHIVGMDVVRGPVSEWDSTSATPQDMHF